MPEVANVARDVRAEVFKLDRLSAAELQRQYTTLFGEPARSKHRAFLQRRVAWKLQQKAYGGLPTAATKRLRELTELLNPLADMAARAKRQAGNAAGVEHGSPRNRSRPGPREIRLPPSGSLIRRVYKGREIVVRVLDSGFEYDGQCYRSLSAIAKVITGAHWNGLLFFGLISQKK